MSATNASATAAWPGLRSQLETLGESFPVAAHAALNADSAAFAPLLAQALAELAADDTPARQDPDYVLHFHLIALLAQWREPAAWAALLQLAHVDEDGELALFGHDSQALLIPALASLSPDDLGGLQQLAADTAVAPWVRVAALSAMAVRAAHREVPRQNAIARIFAVAGAEAARQQALPADLREDAVLSAATGLLAELAAAEHLETLRGWERADLLDTSAYGGWACLEARLQRDPDTALDAARQETGGHIDDATAFLQTLPMFQPAPPEPARPLVPLGGLDPYVRDAAKVGRNDPCPCGSGKKYKKCCGAH